MPYADQTKSKKCQKRWRQKTEKGKAYVARHNRRYRKENLEKLKAYDKNRYYCRRGMSPGEFRRWSYSIVLKWKYNLSRAKYDALIIRSGGLCEICGKHPLRGLDLDHNHQTGMARGLLCRNCNSVIGKFEPYREMVLAYLRRGRPYIKKPT